MNLVYGSAAIAVFVYLVLLTGRMILSFVMSLSHDWRPRGLALLATEACFAPTDPPIKFLRRIFPTIDMGSLRLDVGFMALYFACVLVLNLLLALRNG